MAYIGKTPKLQGLDVTKASSGASVSSTVANTSNTASSSALHSVTVAGGSASDAVYRAAVSGVTTWTWGVDNSATDNFVLSLGTALGTTDAISIDASTRAVTATVSLTTPSLILNGTTLSTFTGTGAVVLASTPTLVTPVLGVATATSINKVAITAPATSATLTVADGKTLTASNTLTFTGTDASSVAFGAGGTVAYTANKLSAFAATTSAELAGVISDETGSGALVFATSPTLTTPVLGVATATSVNKVAITAPATSATLTLIDGTTVTGPASTGTIATLANTETLTNKTLTSPKINENVAVTTTATKLNYLTSATGTTGTASTNVVFSTSPTLVTPVLGAATGSSLVLTQATNANLIDIGTTSANQNTGLVMRTDAQIWTHVVRGDGATTDNYEFTDSTLGQVRIMVRSGEIDAGAPGVTFYAPGANIDASNDVAMNIQFNGDTNPTNGRFIQFGRSGATEIGSISASGASAVAYNTSSDTRLKNNQRPLELGLATVMALAPKRYEWRDDGMTDFGLIAQEVVALVPEAVRIPDSDDQYWSMEYSKMVPILIKAIQELTARVAELEAAK